MNIKILGTGSFLPENIVTNNDIAKVIYTNDEWIKSRTGIQERRIVKEYGNVFMGTKAAKEAIEEAGIKPLDIDLIIVATLSPDRNLPCSACEVQKELGADNAVAFDLNAACSGFLFALNTAYSFINSGIYRNALIIGSEVLSKILDWNDRGTCVLFGDGAGAAFVGLSDAGGIKNMIMHSDGRKGEVLQCNNRGIDNLLVKGENKLDYVSMNGQEVFKFAVKNVPLVIKELLNKADTDIEEIKYFVLHQANVRIISSVAKRLNAPLDKFPINLQKYGNTSSATIPILLDEINKKGLLSKGDKIVLSGFGGGLTWGATLVEW